MRKRYKTSRELRTKPMKPDEKAHKSTYLEGQKSEPKETCAKEREGQAAWRAGGPFPSFQLYLITQVGVSSVDQQISSRSSRPSSKQQSLLIRILLQNSSSQPVG